MIEVIPAILAYTFEEVEKKIRLVEGLTDWVQIDVADGCFVPNQTFNDPKRLKEIVTPLSLEAHLMIAEPWLYLNDWLNSGVKRIIVHYEALLTSGFLGIMVKRIRAKGLEAGVALNPETPWQLIEDYLDRLDVVLFLSIRPGFGGQQFIEETIPKIESFSRSYPNVKLEVDGGIKVGIAQRVAEAGAKILVIGSAIFKAKSPAQAIKEIQEDAMTMRM